MAKILEFQLPVTILVKNTDVLVGNNLTDKIVTHRSVNQNIRETTEYYIVYWINQN